MTGVGKDTFLLLYQGQVGPSRCLEPIIEAVGRVPGVALVIRGAEVRHREPAYRRLARSVGAEDRVFYLDPVPSNRVVAEGVHGRRRHLGPEGPVPQLPLCPAEQAL